jgi:hypothetical protein
LNAEQLVALVLLVALGAFLAWRFRGPGYRDRVHDSA